MKCLEELKIEFDINLKAESDIKAEKIDSINKKLKSKLSKKSDEELFVILTKYVKLIREDISPRGIESPSDVDGYVLIFRLSEPVNDLINLISDSLFIAVSGKNPKYGYISKAEKELRVKISANRNIIGYVTGKFEIEEGLVINFGF
jgi:hypothetical protein